MTSKEQIQVCVEAINTDFEDVEYYVSTKTFFLAHSLGGCLLSGFLWLINYH